VTFAADGYEVLPRLLTSDETSAVAARLDGLRATRAVGVCERPNNVLVPLRWDDGAVTELLHHDELLGRVAAACRGADLRFTSAYLSLKDPASGPLWWHQDWWCWQHPVTWAAPAPQVALVCYLDDTTASSGALRVLPGSHRTSTDLHARLPAAHGAPASPPLDDAAVADRSEQVTIEVRAGDAVLLDYRVLHGTHRHDGNAVRRALIVNFVPTWCSLPVDIRAHLISGSALPRRDEAVPPSLRSVLPDFDGRPRDLALSRDAPASFPSEA
jgi:hypothetical protein